MRDLLTFDNLVVPKIITFVYWLALIAILLGGLFSLLSGFSLAQLFTVPLGMIMAALGARIWCELIIVLFKINDNIKKLAGN